MGSRCGRQRRTGGSRRSPAPPLLKPDSRDAFSRTRSPSHQPRRHRHRGRPLGEMLHPIGRAFRSASPPPRSRLPRPRRRPADPARNARRRIGQFRDGSSADDRPNSRMSPSKAILRPLAGSDASVSIAARIEAGLALYASFKTRTPPAFHQLQPHLRPVGVPQFSTIRSSSRPITRATAIAANAFTARVPSQQRNKRLDPSGSNREIVPSSPHTNIRRPKIVGFGENQT